MYNTVVISLSRLLQECSYQYWPSKVGQPLMSGRLVITMQSEELKNGYYVRKFSIKEDRVSMCACVRACMCVCLCVCE